MNALGSGAQPGSEPAVTGASIARGVDDLVAAEQARARSRAWWLRQQLAEEATLAGLLVAAGETRIPLSVRTAGGWAHRGLIVDVGLDYCTVRVATGLAHLALDAIVVLQPPRRGVDLPLPTPGGVPRDRRLVEVLALAAGACPPAVVRLRSNGGAVNGEIAHVGVDVLAVDGEDGRCYVRVSSVEEVLLGVGEASG
jgi:hypothetical protein